MNRGGVILETTDAATGLPLVGIAAKAVNSTNSKISAASKMTWMDSIEIHLLNVPAGRGVRGQSLEAGFIPAAINPSERFGVEAGMWAWGKRLHRRYSLK